MSEAKQFTPEGSETIFDNFETFISTNHELSWQSPLSTFSHQNLIYYYVFLIIDTL